VVFPRHDILARQVGAAWLSLDHRLDITMFQVASAWGPELARQAPASAGWRQRVMLSQLVIKQVASAREPELARQALASAGWRQRVMLSQLVIKQVWGEHSFNKSQLTAYVTHVRKPAPAESRLRSHQARSSEKPIPVAPSPLRRKADSGRTNPAPVESQLRLH
jgi:hypothetical protein